jgi:hypothetical protein
MWVQRAIGDALPFLMAYALQIFRLASRPLAESMLTKVSGQGVIFQGTGRDVAVELAISFYRQVSFFASLALSAASALALGLRAGSPIPGTVAAFLVMVAFPIWFARWQPFAVADDRLLSRAREMAWGSVAITTILGFATFVSGHS